jgi:DNA/RNA endonuclease YhcR with UshA esterase domain
MRRRALVLLSSLLLVTASIAVAQSTPPNGTGRGMRNYDPATEVTVKGTVEDLTQTTGKRGWAGTHLTLKTDKGAYVVHVGPSSFIAGQGFTIDKGDTLEITGSKSTVNGKEVLLARTLTKDGKVLTLRDEKGIPKWSRGARRGR